MIKVITKRCSGDLLPLSTHLGAVHILRQPGEGWHRMWTPHYSSKLSHLVLILIVFFCSNTQVRFWKRHFNQDSGSIIRWGRHNEKIWFVKEASSKHGKLLKKQEERIVGGFMQRLSAKLKYYSWHPRGVSESDWAEKKYSRKREVSQI